MRISEYIVEFLKELGVRYVFGLQGSGTAVQIIDALGEATGIDYVCTLHEQAAGMAADSYSQVTCNLGACVADCGPGASNLMTCVAGSFYNSNPVIYIIGQPQLALLRKKSKIRHYAYHELDLNIFKPICKYLSFIIDKERVKYEFEKAVYIATSGRPGPVVIAIPDDVTWLQIDPKSQKGYTPKKEKALVLNTQIKSIISSFNESSRPLIVAGNGVKCANATNELRGIVKKLHCPVALTWGAKDILDFDNELNVSSFGVQGTRAGNFAIQNADLIISIGTRLDNSETGFPKANFARGAKIISIDVDSEELNKYQEYDFSVFEKIKCDAKVFINLLNNAVQKTSIKLHEEWIRKIVYWKNKYPVCLKDYYLEPTVNPYVFVEELSNILNGDEIIVTDTSTPRNYMFQAFKNKGHQRMITWLNYACLGYGLPGGIGACFGSDNTVVAIMGDGGLQFNIQELSTVIYNNLNLKVIVFDNGGYANIQHTQNNFIGRHHGTDRSTGLPIPKSEEIAKAYGFPIIIIDNNEDMHAKLLEVMSTKGPVYCSVVIPIDCWTTPCRVGKDPIEDMTPKLNRNEFYKEMIVEPLDKEL